MIFLDRVLQLFAKVFRVLNQRKSVLILLAIGGPLSVFLLKEVWEKQEFAVQVVAVYSLALLPLLLYKSLVYFLLSVFDILVMGFADYHRTYDTDFERVRARISAILYERKVKYLSLDKLALGGEKGLLRMLRDVFRRNYPLIFVCSEKPFLVVKIFRTPQLRRLETIRRQLGGEVIHVHIFHGEDAQAKVIAKLIINALEILGQQNMQALQAEPVGSTIDLKLPAPKRVRD